MNEKNAEFADIWRTLPLRYEQKDEFVEVLQQIKLMTLKIVNNLKTLTYTDKLWKLRNIFSVSFKQYDMQIYTKVSRKKIVISTLWINFVNIQNHLQWVFNFHHMMI